jgi:hypothetical protein
MGFSRQQQQQQQCLAAAGCAPALYTIVRVQLYACSVQERNLLMTGTLSVQGFGAQCISVHAWGGSMNGPHTATASAQPANVKQQCSGSCAVVLVGETRICCSCCADQVPCITPAGCPVGAQELPVTLI